MVSVPVESVNEISSVTVAAPSMTIVSEPVGSTSLLQLVGLDQRPSPASSSQIAVATVSCVGSPAVWRSAVVRVVPLLRLSCKKILVTVQVPVSENCGTVKSNV